MPNYYKDIPELIHSFSDCKINPAVAEFPDMLRNLTVIRFRNSSGNTCYSVSISSE